MKTTSTLLFAIFIAIASFAAPAPGKLNVTVIGNKNIEIMVDNSRYQSLDNSVMIHNLQPGSHTVRVYSVKKNQRRSIWGNNNQLLHSSTIYVRPGYLTNVIIDRNGRAQVNERFVGENRRDGDYNNGRYDRQNDPYDGRYNGNDDPYNDRNDYKHAPVTSQSFSSIVQTLRREYSENSRFAIARQMIDRNYFTSDQVKYLLQLFSSESNKLDLAKYAYRNTADQKNYFVVYDALSFSSSKEQLAEYIRRY
jgi:hypothetical protein